MLPDMAQGDLEMRVRMLFAPCVQVVSHIFCPQQERGREPFLSRPSVLRVPEGRREMPLESLRTMQSYQPAALYIEIQAPVPQFLVGPPFQLLFVTATISSVCIHEHLHLFPPPTYFKGVLNA